MASQQRLDFHVQPGSALTGNLSVPGDKSISHRALMLGAIAEGQTLVDGFLDSEDIRATMKALRMMGVEIELLGDSRLCIQGAGLHGLQAAGKPLDLGNSGTSVRLFAGLLSGQSFGSELRGDSSLMKRPMQRIVEPLALMGADIKCSETGTLPIHIGVNPGLKAITYDMPVASAQLKSALLFAGLYATGKTCVHEPALTRDHSERMLRQFGCDVKTEGKQICLNSACLQGQEIVVPGDISSAAFFLVAASIVPGSDIVLENVGINPTRHAIIEILQLMGAKIELIEQSGGEGEPVANIRVRYSKLKAINIPQRLVAIAIDEMPVLMVAAACASGETQLSGAEELRVKESDRIQATCDGLSSLGIEVRELPDGMLVTGGKFKAGVVNSYTDHRIAMAFSVAALVAEGPVTIQDCENVNTSFPGFEDCFSELGQSLQRVSAEDG